MNDEKTYTKEQLIKASVKYYQEVKDNPERFIDVDSRTPEENGNNNIEYLLTLVE